MLKRTLVINTIISVILGGAAAAFLQLAVAMSSTYFGVLAICSAIGCMLNILCGPNRKEKEEDKKE